MSSDSSQPSASEAAKNKESDETEAKDSPSDSKTSNSSPSNSQASSSTPSNSDSGSNPGDSIGIATISLQQTDQLWDQLSEYLEKFYQAWESDTPPELAEFVPESPVALRKFVLIELIKVDIENRLLLGVEVVSICDYVTQFPELLTEGKVNNELLFEEIDLLRRHDKPIDEARYIDQFPNQVDTIKRFFGSDETKPNFRQLKKRTKDSFSTGETIDDFELLIELGKGAFATVYLARQISMQRLVALKVSSDHGDEPKTLAQLDCKNIVRVYDVRDIYDPPCRLLYMKFVPGGTLQEVIRECAALPLQERSGSSFLTLIDAKAEKTGQDVPLDSRTRQRIMRMKWFELVFWIGAQVGEGLAYAHNQNVLHRDLKPANILLTSEGIPQIVDFNVSYCSEVEGASAETFFGGSLAYMSPEQLEAFDPAHPRQPNDLDARSDLFSLGVIVWELLFGERPYDDSVADGDYSELIHQLLIQRKDFSAEKAINEKQQNWELDIKSLFQKLLAPDPAKRFRSAKSMAGELHLISDPRSRNLLRAPDTVRSRLAKSNVVLIMIFAVVFPSALAAVFNYFHNFKSIIQPKQDIADVFQKVQLVINSIAFPVGMLITALTGWVLQRRADFFGKRVLSSGQTVNSFSVRRMICRLPLVAVVIPLSIWTLAAMAYPIAMYWSGADSLTMGDSLHFLTSLILCGLIASVYPFFIVSFVAIRFWYPSAFHTDEIQAGDSQQINRLQNQTWLFMALGVLLPIFSILLMVTTQKESDRNLLAYLAGASFFGLGFIFYLFQKLERHLDTLGRTIDGLIENQMQS